MADNRGVPTTPKPTWLTSKRKNKKYGGRRGSLGGRRDGSRSSNANGGAFVSGQFRAIRRSVSASSSLDYEVGADGLDLRTQARLERPDGNRSVASTFRIAEDPPDRSAQVSLEPSDDARQSGRTRGFQRPPRPNSANTTTSCTDRNTTQTRKVHLNQFDFEPDNAEDGCGSSSTYEIDVERMQSDVAHYSATAQGTTFIASRSVVEENVHPNDIFGDSRNDEIRPPAAHTPHDVTVDTPAPTRQSARLQKKRSDSFAAAHPNPSDNSVNARSESRAIPRLTERPWNFSSKRNTANTSEDDMPSPSKIAARSSPTSFSSRSQSSSVSSSLFGSQRSSTPIDTSSQETGTDNSSSTSKSPSLGRGLVAAPSTHKTSISMASFLDDEAPVRLKAPPADHHQRSASWAHLGSFEPRPSSPTFQFSHKLSQNTPLSTSSRKRSMEFFSSDGDEDDLGGSERDRKRMPNAPLPFDCLGGSERVRGRGHFESFSLSQGDAVNEEACFFGARSKSLSQGDEPINFPMSPPSKPSRMNADLEFVAEDSADEVRGASCHDTGAIRSKDDDVMSLSSSSTSSSDDEDSSSSNDQETEEEGSPFKAMTDAQIFHCKSSYDDVKFLVKSLGTHVSNCNKGVATMGLNDGCMIALRRGWSYERRGRFSKWIGEAFGFRIKPTGGTGGHYIHCSNTECRDAYDRLKKILKDYKGGRLPMDEIHTEKSKGRDEGSTLLSPAKIVSSHPE